MNNWITSLALVLLLSIQTQAQEISVTDLPPKIAAHAFLMGFAWALFVPIAIMIPTILGKRLTRPPFLVHAGLMILAAVMTLCGFSLIVSAKRDLNAGNINSTHGMAGLAIFIIVMFQVVNGLLRPEKASESASKQMRFLRSAWEGLHHVLGRTLPLIAVFNLYSGIDRLVLVAGLLGANIDRRIPDILQILILSLMSFYLTIWFVAKGYHKWNDVTPLETTVSMIKLNES